MHNEQLKNINEIFSVAPMMDWTDRYCRAFHRVLTRKAVLYSEMVTAPAIIHGDRQHLLAFEPSQSPVVLQLGGSDPGELAQAAQIGAEFGYDEINFNCGCPSDRVQSGRFGACLMAEPQLVADCVTAMQDTTERPITVKCRIGIDDQDAESDLTRFIDVVARSGCRKFIVHARKAWLQGLSPKQNRDVPLLDYDRVYRLKNSHNELTIIINGGIETVQSAKNCLNEGVDGVMLGRAAYQNPWLLSNVDEIFFNEKQQVMSRIEAVYSFIPYIEKQLSEGVRLSCITRHMIGLFHGCPGGRLWRRYLSENACLPGANADVVVQAMAHIKR